MKYHFPLLALVGSALLLSACGGTPPDSAYRRYDGPESLLDVSSEVVNLSVADAQSVSQLADWVQRDAPTRAELYCAEAAPRCKDAKKVFELTGVPVQVMGGGDQTATLIYERILARDCSARYVDNNPNPYNLPTPSLGCAVSANMVQHVSDKQEFVSPMLSDNPLSGPGISAYNRAYVARTPKNPDGYSISDSLITQAKSQ